MAIASRMECKITKRDIVFIMGAGASLIKKQKGVPSHNEWFEKIHDKKIPWLKLEKKQYYANNLKEILIKFYNYKKDRKHNDLPAVENVFNLLDTAINLNNSIGATSNEVIVNYYKNLSDALAFLIRSQKRKTPYADLAKILKNDYTGNIAFVTFNYDILLDIVLLDLRKEGIDLDYGIDMGSYEKDRYLYRNTTLRFDPPRENNFLLLRPHGSLNWLHCRSCGKIFTTREGNLPTKAILGKQTCPLCGGTTGAYIIYPGYDRSYSEPFLSRTWQLMEQTLRYAKKWCFIGYSMSDADRYFQYVLLRAYLSIPKTKRPKIYLVDYMEPSKIEKSQQGLTEKNISSIVSKDSFEKLKKRYNSLFPLKKIYKLGFADFIKNNLQNDILEE